MKILYSVAYGLGIILKIIPLFLAVGLRGQNLLIMLLSMMVRLPGVILRIIELSMVEYLRIIIFLIIMSLLVAHLLVQILSIIRHFPGESDGHEHSIFMVVKMVIGQIWIIGVIDMMMTMTASYCLYLPPRVLMMS